MTGQLISASLAGRLRDRFRERQNDIEAFIRALVEVESPSGDLDGSREVVDLLVNAARGLECVSDVERVMFRASGNML